MLPDFWYIATASNQLRSAPRPIRVLDKELVLFRDGAGIPHALLDRCAHRGTRLALGQVVEGALACRYHGWRYAGDGRCVHIPSLTSGQRVPERAAVASFPCVEQDSYVWVWIAPSRPDPPGPPPIRGFTSSRWRQGSTPFECDWLKGVENNVDWCHPFFTHPWTHGQFFITRFWGFREQQFEWRVTEGGLTVFAPVTGSPDEPIPERPWVRLSFDLPNCVRVEFWRPVHMVVVMYFVATGPSTCRVEWLVTRLLPLGRRVRWSRGLPRILAQDRLVLESAQSWYDRAGGEFEVSVEADTATLAVRRIVALAANGRWPAERTSMPPRRVVDVRA